MSVFCTEMCRTCSILQAIPALKGGHSSSNVRRCSPTRDHARRARRFRGHSFIVPVPGDKIQTGVRLNEVPRAETRLEPTRLACSAPRGVVGGSSTPDIGSVEKSPDDKNAFMAVALECARPARREIRGVEGARSIPTSRQTRPRAGVPAVPR
jgi:hypothetical protein